VAHDRQENSGYVLGGDIVSALNGCVALAALIETAGGSGGSSGFQELMFTGAVDKLNYVF